MVELQGTALCATCLVWTCTLLQTPISFWQCSVPLPQTASHENAFACRLGSARLWQSRRAGGFSSTSGGWWQVERCPAVRLSRQTHCSLPSQALPQDPAKALGRARQARSSLLQAPARRVQVACSLQAPAALQPGPALQTLLQAGRGRWQQAQAGLGLLSQLSHRPPERRCIATSSRPSPSQRRKMRPPWPRPWKSAARTLLPWSLTRTMLWFLRMGGEPQGVGCQRKFAWPAVVKMHEGSRAPEGLTLRSHAWHQ